MALSSIAAGPVGAQTTKPQRTIIVMIDSKEYEVIETSRGRGAYAFVASVRSVETGQTFALRRLLGENADHSNSMIRKAYLLVENAGLDGQLAFIPRTIKLQIRPDGNVYRINETAYLSPLAISSLDDEILEMNGRDVTVQERTEIILKVLSGVLQELAAFNNVGLVHNDLKPSNILQSQSGKWGMSDFDSVTPVFGEPEIGSPLHRAPELIKDFVASGLTDVYSMGVVALEMLSAGKHERLYPEVIGSKKWSRYTEPVPVIMMKGVEQLLNTVQTEASGLDPKVAVKFTVVRNFIEAATQEDPWYRNKLLHELIQNSQLQSAEFLAPLKHILDKSQTALEQEMMSELCRDLFVR